MNINDISPLPFSGKRRPQKSIRCKQPAVHKRLAGYSSHLGYIFVPQLEVSCCSKTPNERYKIVQVKSPLYMGKCRVMVGNAKNLSIVTRPSPKELLQPGLCMGTCLLSMDNIMVP